MITLRPKDPDEILFYKFDWGTKRLEDGEVVVDSKWFITGGTAYVSDVDGDGTPVTPTMDSGGVNKVWIAGGAVGETNILTNRIITSTGRQRGFSGKIRIKDK